MKRFFCETCQKVKRVRVLPDDASENLNAAAKPGHRMIGTCRWHAADERRPRKVLNSRQHRGAKLGSTRKMSASAAKSKSKKG